MAAASAGKLSRHDANTTDPILERVFTVLFL
jgi:hypothetical protein